MVFCDLGANPRAVTLKLEMAPREPKMGLIEWSNNVSGEPRMCRP